MSEESPNDHQLSRKYLFTLCETKEELHDWIVAYLELDLPDSIVDPQSNSTPMSVVWEVYDKARKNDDEDFNRVLAYASRDSAKTLSASILEVLMVLHLQRNVAHMAAIEQQARKAQYYTKGFFNRPVLREFVTNSNERRIEVTRYEHTETGENLSSSQWNKLPLAEKTYYKEIKNYIQIIIATISGCNAEHVNFMCVDGDTRISIASLGSRTRVQRTACGIFSCVAGLPVGGRPPRVAEDLEIINPVSRVEVLTFNFDSGGFEFKPITRAHRRTADATELICDDSSLIATDDHPVYVADRGFVELRDVTVGDRIVLVQKMKGNVNHARAYVPIEIKTEQASPGESQWEQVVLGSLLGDGGVYKKPTNNAYFKEQHSLEQAQYLDWKRQILSQKVRVRASAATSGYTGAEQVCITTGNSPLFNDWVKFKDTLCGVERLGALGLAVWYMDDGCAGNGIRFSSECFSLEQNETLADVLHSKFGIQVDVRYYNHDGKGFFYLGGPIAAKRRLVEICTPFIHPEMAYKFDTSRNTTKCQWCGSEFWFIDQGNRAQACSAQVCRLLQQGTLKLSVVNAVTQVGRRVVYDFTVADNHNFFGNRILNKNCIDEVDIVANPAAYEEAKAIPSPFKGKLPITLLTSTRKYSFGLVQKEIDDAAKTGLHIRHWNLTDMTQVCPSSRHRPDLPKLSIYRSDELLRAVSEEEWKGFTPDQQALYVKDEGYDGCLSNCKIFAQCQGRLATRQASRSKLLKPISDTINKFRATSLEFSKSQLLCWKPSSQGLIYSRFDRDVHMLTAAEMAQLITGEEHKGDSKQDLIRLMQSREIKFFAGMDWGYSHCFAVVVGARDGNRMFILDAIEIPELELAQKLDLCETKLKPFDPIIFPDPSYPSDIKTFKRNGYRMKDWDKYKGSVVGGIEVVRMKLWPTVGTPQLFFLREDEGCEQLAHRLSTYHWMQDAAGRSTDQPDEEEDDALDALRYLVMNVFAPKGSLVVDKTVPARQTSTLAEGAYTHENWMSKTIAERTGEQGGSAPMKVRKGGFVFDG